MSISGIGAAQAAKTAQTVLTSNRSERAEGPGPDKVNDFDSDDRKSAPPSGGAGRVVDLKA